MPFTPFHFGPGAFLKCALSDRFSFVAFAASQVVVDLETGYFILRRDFPLHRAAHTYLGAVGVALVTALVICPIIDRIYSWYRRQRRLPFAEILPARSHGLRTVLFSTLLGTLSHVFLDSLVHFDVRPFAPISEMNPLVGHFSIQLVQFTCLIVGIVSAIYWIVIGKKA